MLVFAGAIVGVIVCKTRHQVAVLIIPAAADRGSALCTSSDADERRRAHQRSPRALCPRSARQSAPMTAFFGPARELSSPRAVGLRGWAYPATALTKRSTSPHVAAVLFLAPSRQGVLAARPCMAAGAMGRWLVAAIPRCGSARLIRPAAGSPVYRPDGTAVLTYFALTPPQSRPKRSDPAVKVTLTRPSPFLAFIFGPACGPLAGRIPLPQHPESAFRAVNAPHFYRGRLDGLSDEQLACWSGKKYLTASSAMQRHRKAPRRRLVTYLYTPE